MLVQFTATGQVMDTAMATFSKGPAMAARTLVDLDTEPTDIAYVGVRSSGTPLAITGLAAVAYLIWKTKNGTTYLWKMDDAAAVTTAVTALLAAYSNAPAADVSVTLTSAGVVAAV